MKPEILLEWSTMTTQIMMTIGDGRARLQGKPLFQAILAPEPLAQRFIGSTVALQRSITVRFAATFQK
jgi:hypothetical protein